MPKESGCTNRKHCQLTPKEVKVWAKNEGKTPVIVVTKSVSVQSYLDAEEPLRMLGLNVGLAVEHESEVKNENSILIGILTILVIIATKKPNQTAWEV